MRKLIATLAIAAVLPMTAMAVEGEGTATDPLATYLAQDMSMEEAVAAALAADPELSLAEAIGAAMDNGANVDTAMTIALAQEGFTPSDAVAAVTFAGSTRNVNANQVRAAAQNANVAGNDIAAGIIQGAGTAAGNGNGNGNNNGSQNGENGNGTDGAPGQNQSTPGQTGNTPANTAVNPVIPTPPPNAQIS